LNISFNILLVFLLHPFCLHGQIIVRVSVVTIATNFELLNSRILLFCLVASSRIAYALFSFAFVSGYISV
jgi:hypothetical protein